MGEGRRVPDACIEAFSVGQGQRLPLEVVRTYSEYCGTTAALQGLGDPPVEQPPAVYAAAPEAPVNDVDVDFTFLRSLERLLVDPQFN